MIRIMIADDQLIVLSGLKTILNMEEDLEVVATAPDGEALLFELKNQTCDVVVMDIQMPNLDGVETTKRVKDLYPEVKVLVLTTFLDDNYVLDALKYGASGYLLKDTAPDEIANAIRTVSGGGTLLNEHAATTVMARLKGTVQAPVRNPIIDELTQREVDILKLIGQGKSNKEIAKSLFITEGTVKNNITRMLSKLELRDRTQLAIFAIHNNVVG
ncbi:MULTISPECIES: response regulator transcription factor [unclassified Fusibacter]|uniref:response regulator transcription factor n=1 Tax=unclassified Fusibacter TaxID=2624464 RepID=UPI0010117842|nr:MULTISPECIES: response regulator transcription factor [unclassified Fusibacter]MCK8059794.1 response regulator transcription factor [Fusibacter sp. A2]NPE21595.1 response regulator transcription factor [Fusibacter sp. A1]RXV62002.1 DNA-binding response regulator [Fusibacter sp. A1]